MTNLTTKHWYALSAAAGAGAAVLFALTPLTAIAAVAGAIVLPRFGAGLPSGERRWLTWLLAAAIALRLMAIGVVFAHNLPLHDDQFLGASSGDEAYVMNRALRTRAILGGAPTTKYDFFVAYDEYGRNRFVLLVTALQVVFGPTPYGLRLVNALIFLSAVLVLFRLVRRTLGPPAAFGGLLVVLFWPTLFAWSISLLKEPLYLLCGATFLYASVAAADRPGRRPRLAWIAVAITAALCARDLRTGAIALAVSGIALGAVLYGIAASPWVRAAAAAAAFTAVALVAASPYLQQRILTGLQTTAKIQTGHVFTVGHAYKVLDPLFYARPATPSASRLTLTPDEAARYVIRAGLAFVVVPVPWQLQSARELAYLPEQIAWYVLLLLLPPGLVAAARRHRLASCMLIGFVLPTAAILALTNGNVGTLLRLRGLVVPYIAWLSAAGVFAIVHATEQQRRMPFLDAEGRVFGRVNLVDAILIAFAVVLIPLAYGTYLLFRTPALHITRVMRVPITREERRVAGGSLLAAKIKVQGTGLRPLLRASIDDTPALAFVFEDAHSADVLVGGVPPGTHDLILFDGVQEVARAPRSVTIQPEPAAHVLALGAFECGSRAEADRLTIGAVTAQAAIVNLGAPRAGMDGRWRRDAELRFECEPDPAGEGCSVAGTPLTAAHPVVHLTAASGEVLSFFVSELLPVTTPRKATAHIRLTSAPEILRLIRVGARDDLLDERAATVVNIGARPHGTSDSLDVTMLLGIDLSADGWRYRGRTLRPGAPFTLTTTEYVVTGLVLSIDVASETGTK